MAGPVKRVCLLGAESTGKTTLAKALAAEYDTVWNPEFGRPYTEIGRDPDAPWTSDEFTHIARIQCWYEDTLARSAREVALVHPLTPRLELTHAVVLPRCVEPAHDEEVVRARDQLVEAGRRPAEVDLVKDGGRERVGVREQHAMRERGEEVLVPALDPRDVRELRARPGRVVRSADLRIGTAVLGIPRRVEMRRERTGEGRLARRLRPEQADALHVDSHGAGAYAPRGARGDGAGGSFV